MSSTRSWTTSADIRHELDRRWKGGDLLAALVTEEPLFPLTLSIRKPASGDISARFEEVRQWIQELCEGSRLKRGFGYEIQWTDINHRQLGRNQTPEKILLFSEEDAYKLIGKERQARRFKEIVRISLEQFPEIRPWLARYPHAALGESESWEKILAILSWFKANPRPNLYLRQLEIQGVDTKFIEARRGVLSNLLSIILPPDALDDSAGGVHAFERKFGLVVKPPLVRFRVLDASLRIAELSDLSIPVADFAKLALNVDRVFITENDINGLAFPEVSKSIIVFGLGYGIDRLSEIEWLRNLPLHYWGDIDTHGFAILNRLRSYFPRVESFLMDKETLIAHRDMWGEEPKPFVGVLARLTTEESTLYRELVQNAYGERVRLEQERISFAKVRERVGKIA